MTRRVGFGSASDRAASGDTVEHKGSDVSSTSSDVREDDGDSANVRVHVQEPGDGEWVTVRVEDDGPGLPAHERAVVLGDDEITSTQHGSGVGLWIAKWAVESARGELLVPTEDEVGDADDANDEIDSAADGVEDADGAVVVVVRLEPVSN